VKECWLCPVFASFTLVFALQLRRKHGKTSVRVKKNLSQVKRNLSQGTVCILPKHSHAYILPKHPHKLPKHPHYYQNTHMYTYYQNTHTNYQNTHTITKTPTLLSKHPHTFGNRLPIDMVSPLENGVLNHKRHFFDAKNEFKKSYILPLQRTKRRQYLNRNQHGNCSSKKCSMYHFQSKHFNNAVTDHTSTA